MEQKKIERLMIIADSISAHLNKAWHGSMTGGVEQDVEWGLHMAKQDLQSLNDAFVYESLLPTPNPEDNAVSEVAARQAEIRDVKHEMD